LKKYEKYIVSLERKLESCRLSVDQYRTLGIRLSNELDTCKTQVADALEEQVFQRVKFQEQIGVLQNENEVE
jgi:hypothetical protein